MGSIADLLGEKADNIARELLNIGDVHLLQLGEENGITPKGNEQLKDKFLVILGFDDEGNIIGGVVINSRINYNLPQTVTDYLISIKADEYSFLKYNSFVNCSRIITAKRDLFNALSYRGALKQHFVEDIKETLLDNPAIDKAELRMFGIIQNDES